MSHIVAVTDGERQKNIVDDIHEFLQVHFCRPDEKIDIRTDEAVVRDRPRVRTGPICCSLRLGSAGEDRGPCVVCPSQGGRAHTPVAGCNADPWAWALGNSRQLLWPARICRIRSATAPTNDTQRG